MTPLEEAWEEFCFTHPDTPTGYQLEDLQPLLDGIEEPTEADIDRALFQLAWDEAWRDYDQSHARQLRLL